jgi:hypothetical protein
VVVCAYSPTRLRQKDHWSSLLQDQPGQHSKTQKKANESFHPGDFEITLQQGSMFLLLLRQFCALGSPISGKQLSNKLRTEQGLQLNTAKFHMYSQGPQMLILHCKIQN